MSGGSRSAPDRARSVARGPGRPSVAGQPRDRAGPAAWRSRTMPGRGPGSTTTRSKRSGSRGSGSPSAATASQQAEAAARSARPLAVVDRLLRQPEAPPGTASGPRRRRAPAEDPGRSPRGRARGDRHGRSGPGRSSQLPSRRAATRDSAASPRRCAAVRAGRRIRARCTPGDRPRLTAGSSGAHQDRAANGSPRAAAPQSSALWMYESMTSWSVRPGTMS